MTLQSERTLDNFTDLARLDVSQIDDLLRLASKLEAVPETRALEGKVLGLLFLNPSLRTLASFQAGMSRLGGSSFVINPGQGTWNLELRRNVVMDGAAAEHIREAIPVLASYSDALGVRVFAAGDDLQSDMAEPFFSTVEELCPVPLINMESAMDHPCQALADWKTLDDLGVPRAGGKFVLSWANHPRALPLAVPSAVVKMAALRGMDVTVLRPEGYALPEAIMESARQATANSGGSVRETADQADALAGAEVVYAKSWGSPEHYGDAAAEAELRRGFGSSWCVDESWFAGTADGCRFLHCLPVRRGVVVADEVLDGPRSEVVRQARNRMFAQMAVLYRLLRGKEPVGS